MRSARNQREYDKFVEGQSGETAIRTLDIGKLVPEQFDAINLSYTGDNLTQVEYLTGGTGGTAVATLTLGYTGDKLTSVEKS